MARFELNQGWFVVHNFFVNFVRAVRINNNTDVTTLPVELSFIVREPVRVLTTCNGQTEMLSRSCTFIRMDHFTGPVNYW